MVGLAQSLGLRSLSRMQTIGARQNKKAGGYTPPAWLLNYDPAQFTKMKADFALTKAGTARSKILAYGESTTRGEWTDPAGDHWNNTHKNSWPGQLASILTATKGIPTNIEDYFAGGGKVTIVPITANRNSIKAGFNAAAPWAESNSTSMGGTMFQNVTDATPLSVTTEVPVDTIELFDIQASGGGVISYNIDGGAETQLTQTNATTLSRKTVINVALGIHTLNVKRVSGTAFFAGYRAYNSAVKAIDVINGAQGAAQISDLLAASTGYASYNVMLAQAASASVVIINEQINDELNNTVAATFKAGITSLITGIKGAGASVLMMTGNPVNTANVADATQQNYRQYLIDTAIANNVAIVDQYAIYGSFTNAVALFGAQNALHPGYTWTQNLAQLLAGVIAGIGDL